MSAMDPAIQRLILGQHHDPFEILGIHPQGNEWIIRAFLPDVDKVYVMIKNERFKMKKTNSLFEIRVKNFDQYQFELNFFDGTKLITHDPYSFGPIISDFDLQLINEGNHHRLWEVLGAHICTIDGVLGTYFAVWAPNAERVSVVGNWNSWNGLRNPMRVRGSSGVWEIFIPGVGEKELYKFEIRAHNGQIFTKSDPFAFLSEQRPRTASQICQLDFVWSDDQWLKNRNQDHRLQPISIYEVHLGSWARVPDEGNRWLTYREIAPKLADYVEEMGFTHIELLPILEHPLDASWGYQVTGYFAPTSRFGSPEDFAWFVDHFHSRGIGVLLDWVPAHFPQDGHALAHFDGTALYEKEDPREGYHPDWGTLIFNYGRREVANFLIASALFWLEKYHIDGLRVDAVASMLYLDFSRKEGEWIPNQFGGRENLEAIAFLKRLNELTHLYHPGTLTIAEESTSFPGITKPTYVGGLGFDFKWAMGWMNDTLRYIERNPIHRHWHHHEITFYGLYAFFENHMLPISHDEVVHLKKSLLDKMPGDYWQKFANLRLYLTMMWTISGKKLLFMGQEFGVFEEWSHEKSLDWHLLDFSSHQGIKRLVKELNKIYKNETSLHQTDNFEFGLRWISADDNENSVYSYLRQDQNGDFIVVVLNMTPIIRHNYHIGVPKSGKYIEIFNSDAEIFCGSNVGNFGLVESEQMYTHNQPYSLNLTLPPLAGLIFRLEKNNES